MSAPEVALDSTRGKARSDTTLEQAILRVAAGDRGAFADVYEMLAPRLRRYLGGFCHDRHLVEDLLQLTFIRLFESSARFDARSRALPWAYAIARNIAIDAYRRRRARREIFESHEESAAWAEAPRTEEAPAIVALRALPAHQRQAIRLTLFDGLTSHEAAEFLGTTPLAVRLRVHRGYEALRKQLRTDATNVPARTTRGAAA